ncbi:MAG: M16 family metallopeptidase [Pseudomonadota bacterium]
MFNSNGKSSSPGIVALLFLFFWLLPLPALAAVKIERVVSPGGVEAWLVEDHSMPLISVALGFRGGAAADPADKAGLATLVSGLLDEGAGPLDSEAFQRRLSDLAIDLDFDAGMDDFRGSMRTLTEHRDEAFDLLRLALAEPRFDAEPIDRVKGQIQAVIASHADDPATIARDAWWHTVFPDHGYGRDPLGSPESLARITADDLRGFVRAHFARDRLEIGVVGDITAAELAPLLDKTFGALPAEGAPDPVPEAKPVGAGKLIVIRRQVPQSVILLGEPGIKRDDPDFYAATLLMETLGGGFGSRLTREVREKRGLAYSISADLATYDKAGLILGQTATENGRAKESMAVIRKVWADLAAEGPTQAELDDARSYILGSYPLRFTSSRAIAGNLVSLQLDRLGIDYSERRAALFGSVTLDDVKRVAKRLLDPDALTWVVVGEPDGVDATE